jgi:hypothetical protein
MEPKEDRPKEEIKTLIELAIGLLGVAIGLACFLTFLGPRYSVPLSFVGLLLLCAALWRHTSPRRSGKYGGTEQTPQTALRSESSKTPTQRTETYKRTHERENTD